VLSSGTFRRYRSGGTGRAARMPARPDVALVVMAGRSAAPVQHGKLREIIHTDLWNYASLEKELSGFDACFFCLGVSAAGMQDAGERTQTVRNTDAS
jgi:hypothetical protein